MLEPYQYNTDANFLNWLSPVVLNHAETAPNKMSLVWLAIARH